MSVSYKLRLCFGYEIKESIAMAPFLKSHTEVKDGIFHMEDRFDPKTGVKVNPEKIWDVKPINRTTRWYEIGNHRIEEHDALEAISSLEQHYDCYVECFGSFVAANSTKFVFYVNEPISWKDAADYGRFSVYNDLISLDEISKLTPKVLELKRKLEADGLKVDEPRCFLAILEG